MMLDRATCNVAATVFTGKDATVKRYHYDDHDQLRRHLADFVAAYNFARRLKTLKGLTPFEFVSKCWTSEPDRFKLNPLHQMQGLNTILPPVLLPPQQRTAADVRAVRLRAKTDSCTATE